MFLGTINSSVNNATCWVRPKNPSSFFFFFFFSFLFPQPIPRAHQLKAQQRALRSSNESNHRCRATHTHTHTHTPRPSLFPSRHRLAVGSSCFLSDSRQYHSVSQSVSSLCFSVQSVLCVRRSCIRGSQLHSFLEASGHRSVSGCYSPDGGVVSVGSSCFLSDSRQVRQPVSQSVTSLSLSISQSVSQSVSLCFSVCAGRAFSAHTQSLLEARKRMRLTSR